MICQYGLTGGMGSGKSFIADIFIQMGVPVYISDQRAKELYFQPNIKHAILSLLGEQTYKNKRPDFAYIASLVFKNKSLLQGLNNIIHPAVAADFNEWISQHEDKPYLLKESAILIENNLHLTLDGLITVVAPRELRIQRILQRDKTNRASILERMQNQTDDKRRINLSDFVIYNCPSHNLLRQIQFIHQKLITKHSR